MFIQEAKQVAFNFRLQQMCNYKKQKFTRDQKMTSYYIVSVQLHGQFETAWNNSIISEKHWGKETLVKMSLKPRTTRKALNCSWLRKWTILTSTFWLDISEAIIKLPLGRNDNHAFACPSPAARPPSFLWQLGACWPKLYLYCIHHVLHNIYYPCRCSLNPGKMKESRKEG